MGRAALVCAHIAFTAFQTRAHSPRGGGPPLLLVTVACATSALALSSCSAAWTLAGRVDFCKDTARVFALAWADPLATLATRRSRLIVSTTRDKGAMARVLSVSEAACCSKSRSRGASSSTRARALGTDGAVYDLTLGMTQTCSCPAFRFKRGDAQCKHLAWLKTKVLGVPASHYLAYQR